jgi:hypothetical protein
MSTSSLELAFPEFTIAFKGRQQTILNVPFYRPGQRELDESGNYSAKILENTGKFGLTLGKSRNNRTK